MHNKTDNPRMNTMFISAAWYLQVEYYLNISFCFQLYSRDYLFTTPTG